MTDAGRCRASNDLDAIAVGEAKIDDNHIVRSRKRRQTGFQRVGERHQTQSGVNRDDSFESLTRGSVILDDDDTQRAVWGAFHSVKV